MTISSELLFASLPWYDLPEMRTVNDAVWLALSELFKREGLTDVPEAFDRERPYGRDDAGECLFTQACGYLLFGPVRDHFTVLGAPCYTAPGCEGPLHRSFIMVRRSSAFLSIQELRGTRFAVNERDSNSGMNLPRLLFAPLAQEGRFFSEVIVTGSHAASAESVAGGNADAAAIDCVTFALLQRYRPQAIRGLRALAVTAATSAPPFVTSRKTAPDKLAAMRRALYTFCTDRTYRELREEVLLHDVVLCNADAYRPIAEFEEEAQRLGYPVLR